MAAGRVAAGRVAEDSEELLPSRLSPPSPERLLPASPLLPENLRKAASLAKRAVRVAAEGAEGADEDDDLDGDEAAEGASEGASPAHGTAAVTLAAAVGALSLGAKEGAREGASGLVTLWRTEEGEVGQAGRERGREAPAAFRASPARGAGNSDLSRVVSHEEEKIASPEPAGGR